MTITRHNNKIRLSLIVVCTLFSTISHSNTDNMAERLQACAGCHDRSDATTTDKDYAPSIKGKPVEYLYQQLLNYQEGRRVNPVMSQMLAYLSHEYLHDIAAYYSQQELSANSFPSNQQHPQHAEQAKQLVLGTNNQQYACIACHGGDLRGNGVAIPSLRGLSAEYLSAQLGSWRAGTRHARQPDCMADVAKSLNGADVLALANWIASANDTLLETTPPVTPLPIECGAVQ